jgi:hypothetical protein
VDSSLFVIVALSTLMFGAMKFTFWANAVIFLSLMKRDIPRIFWTWTPVEAVLSAVASISFCAAIILREGPILAAPFGIAALSWLAYMTRRVWVISRPRQI